MEVYDLSPCVSCAQTLICSQTLTGRVPVGMGQNCARIHAQGWPSLLPISLWGHTGALLANTPKLRWEGWVLSQHGGSLLGSACRHMEQQH